MQPDKVKIVEVGPRDGLQNEKALVPTEIKVALIDQLTEAGFTNIEAASFVSPKWVPQMADGAEVMARIRRRPGTLYSALTPNMKGLDAALAAGADEVVIFGATSEAFSQKNINCSIAESMARFEPVAAAAKERGIRLRASVSCSLGCPYQGDVPVGAVVDLVRRMRELGCDEIDIADTIGVGTPDKVQEVMRAASTEFPLERLSGHFHDTYGHALSNVRASLEVGIRIFHSSVAGLGGCPYAKGATGNVATEALLRMMQSLGVETGIDAGKVAQIGEFISRAVGNRGAGSVVRSRVGNQCASDALNRRL
ncbi:hydroxymethylglutaryl-CoA lyase [Cupriavidus sp. SK-4]|uniref:hydroxymethylglutaryl-CoA lyase n=1 Tax=Cupriavidus sp. SK-4 TaxID=574750 RepID=UPI00044D327F|nr:hydroxymethylglutaryl-CoA lyase [Cupriavidus sp. SK-4]EYS91839.1 hydroxymethylglutaryl-CoA lyase [Cupriavidus sp. SK-4]